jgi:hypothetical protein
MKPQQLDIIFGLSITPEYILTFDEKAIEKEILIRKKQYIWPNIISWLCCIIFVISYLSVCVLVSTFLILPLIFSFIIGMPMFIICLSIFENVKHFVWYNFFKDKYK